MKIITIILLTVFALNSCGNTKSTTNMKEMSGANKTVILSGKYHISSFNDIEYLPEDMHLNFDNAPNRISGFAGCNHFSSEYTVNGNTIKFGQFISTKMYCKRFMDLEQEVLNALNKVTSFSIENNVLNLKNDKENLITASKKQ